MANFEVLETYNSEIEKLEPTTPGHADVFNAIFQQLINNDAFIKKVAEQQLTIIQSHLNNENEPHQKVFDTYYRQLVNYTDKAIADLINGAPETADTLRELADLIDKNKDVTTALNEAIGKKANQTELDQAISNINTLNSGLASHKSASDHDNRYYTKAQIDSKNDVFTKKINEYNIDAATEANNLTWLVVLDGVTLKHREMRTLHVDKADYLSSFWASDGVPHKISFGFDSASWNVIVYVDGVQIGKIVN